MHNILSMYVCTVHVCVCMHSWPLNNMGGLGVPIPRTVENLYMTFDFPET